MHSAAPASSPSHRTQSAICFYVSYFIILGLILDSSLFSSSVYFIGSLLVTLRLQIGRLNITVIILFGDEAHHKAYYTL